MTPFPPPRRRPPVPPPTAEEALVTRLTALADPRRLHTSEQTFLLVLAGLVGVYGGLAAGLFGTVISLLRIAFFRTNELLTFLSGDPVLQARFASMLAARRWHPELAVMGLVAVLAAVAWGLVRRGREREDVWAPRLVTVAVVSGAGLLLFYSVLFFGAFDRTFLRVEGGLLELVEDSPWWLVLGAPAVGGLLVGWLIRRYSPESRGHGVTEVLEAVAVHQSRIAAKTAVFKGLTASLTIASGGSVGREGPVVQIGSAVGSAVGQRVGVSRPQLRLLVGCGAAAGISASFDAPIAGAMFALEIILADFGVATFSPIVLASVLATVVSRALTHRGHLDGLATPEALAAPTREIVQTAYHLVSPWELGPYLVLGVLCGIIAIAFIASLDRLESLFDGEWGGPLARRLGRMGLPGRAALGGGVVGLLGLVVPQVLGAGYETMNAALHEQLEPTLVIAILFGKLLATSVTLGSGGSGGSFFPTMFLGAMAGSAFGAAVHAAFPTLTASSGAYALVGMGALVAAAIQGPLTGIIMLFELTGDYQIILPLMVSCIASTQLVNRWLGWSIYSLRLAHRGIDLRPTRNQEALRSIPVREAMSRAVETIPRALSFKALLHRLADTPHLAWPVVDEAGRYTGMLAMADVRAFLFEEGLSELVVAGDLARTDTPPLLEDEDLQTALERIATVDHEYLPVVAATDPTRVVGLLSRRDLLLAIERSRQAVREG